MYLAAQEKIYVVSASKYGFVRMMSRTTAACQGGLEPGTQFVVWSRKGRKALVMATMLDTVCLTTKIGKTREKVLLSQYLF